MLTNSTQISKKNEEKVSVYRPKKFIYNTETHVTTIFFPYDLLPGYYTLNMIFSGLVAEDGGFRIYMNKQNDRV